MSRSLPEGWSRASLGDVCFDRVAQGSPSDRPVAYIDIGSIDRATKRVGPTKTVTGSDAPTRARQWVRAGDVLVSLTRPNLNAVACVGRDLDGAVASTGFDVLRPFGVRPEWLFFRVQSNEFVTDVCEDLQGVVYPAIRPDDVRRHELPVPPLSEQRRIVEAIESYLTRLDDAVATLERVQHNLKRYRASVLRAAVEGRLVPTEAELARAEGRDYEPASVLLERILVERRRRWEEAELAKMTAKGRIPKDDRWKARYSHPFTPDPSALPNLPEGWCWSTVDQLAEVGTGATPYRGEKRFWAAGDVPWVTSSAVNKPFVVEPSDHVTLAALAETTLRLYPPGTLLMAMYGEGKTRGKVAELKIEATINQALAAIQLRGETVTLGSWLRVGFEDGYERLRRPSAGGVQPNLNLSLVRSQAVALAPVLEQNRALEAVDRSLSFVGAVTQSLAVDEGRCLRLRQSILKWAFEGRLVDQDPTDEPASALVERIRAESETAAAIRQARRGRRKVGRRKS